MGRRGPSPTPNKLLLLRGSRRARTDGLQVAPPVAAPPMPPWVKKQAGAVSVWKALVPELVACGLLATLDAVALGRYCVMVSRWVELEGFIQEHGHGFPVYGPPERDENGNVVLGDDGKPVKPLVAVRSYPHARQAAVLVNQLLVLERELGLTPSARSRIFTDRPEAQPDGQEADGFFSFG